MENFNKNWLIILLVAVFFGTLGFLLGRTTGHGYGREHGYGHGRQEMMMFRHHPADSLDIQVQVEAGGDIQTTIKVDTVIKDGKQIIIKEVQKVKKK
jgi:hypothetical protein